jgi:hypothetical protein
MPAACDIFLSYLGWYWDKSVTYMTYWNEMINSYWCCEHELQSFTVEVTFNLIWPDLPLTDMETETHRMEVTCSTQVREKLRLNQGLTRAPSVLPGRKLWFSWFTYSPLGSTPPQPPIPLLGTSFWVNHKTTASICKKKMYPQVNNNNNSHNNNKRTNDF